MCMLFSKIDDKFDFVLSIMQRLHLHRLWLPRQWNLPENYTRQLLKPTYDSDLIIERFGKTIHVCVRASAWFPTNQCLASALWLTNHIASGQVRWNSLLLSASSVALHPLVQRLCHLSLVYSSTPPRWSLLIHSISLANAYLFYPWGHSLC